VIANLSLIKEDIIASSRTATMEDTGCWNNGFVAALHGALCADMTFENILCLMTTSTTTLQ
jgi:hypothetical protein